MRQRALAFVTAIMAAGSRVEDGLARWVDGFVDNLKSSADTIGSDLGGGLVRVARDSLTSLESSARITSLIDSLVGAALSSAQRNSPALVDSVFGPSLHRSVDSIVGIPRRQTAGLHDDLLGARKHARLEALRGTLLGAGTRGWACLLRDE